MRENKKGGNSKELHTKNLIDEKKNVLITVQHGTYILPPDMQKYKNILISHYYMKGNLGKTRNTTKRSKGKKGGEQFHRLRKFAALLNFIEISQPYEIS